MKILAINDLQDNLTTLQAMVREALPESTLLTTLDGSCGLELARTEDPDVILLDSALPGMDGLEVCRQLKRAEPVSAIPVIFVTALRSDREHRLQALAVGAEAFLSKPIDDQELIATVRAMGKIKAANRLIQLEREGLARLVAERTRELEVELSERKKAQERMAEALNFNQAILRFAPVGIFVYQASGGCISCNAAAAEIVGGTKEQILQQNFRQLASWKPSGLLAAAETALATQTPQEHETHVVTSFGKEAWMACRFVLFAYGKAPHLLVTVADITTRQRYEAEIERLNRLYFTLGQINQAIVRVPSRRELLSEICRTIVECGGFKMAWVGWVNSETQEIVPVAQHGDTGGYLSGLRLYADDRSEGPGLTGTAIREGRTYVSNDFANDPRTRFWKAAGAAQGFQAAVAVPIRFDGSVCGALMAYATEVDFFGAREVELLEEVGADIAYALDHLELEQKRRSAEAALQESAENFRAIFEKNTAAIAIINPDGTIALVNDEYCKISGYSREEVVGMNWMRQIVPEDLERLKEYNHRRLTDPDGVPVKYEFKFHHKNGEIREALVSVALIPGLEKIITSFLDITERKQAEAALSLSEQRFAAFMEHLPAAVFIKDATGRTVFANGYLQKLLNFQDWEDKTTPELVPGEVGLQMAEDDRKALAQGPLKLQEVILDRHGVTRTFETIKFPIHVEGRRSLLGGVAVDITELRQAEDQLKQQLTELRRWHEVTQGREARILELKREVNRLLVAAGQSVRYSSVAPPNTNES